MNEEGGGRRQRGGRAPEALGDTCIPPLRWALPTLGLSVRRDATTTDSPEKLARQYGNLVRIRPFLGDPDDEELKWLGLYLPELAGEENVRRVEKRDWRQRLQRKGRSITELGRYITSDSFRGHVHNSFLKTTPSFIINLRFS